MRVSTRPAMHLGCSVLSRSGPKPRILEISLGSSAAQGSASSVYLAVPAHSVELPYSTLDEFTAFLLHVLKRRRIHAERALACIELLSLQPVRCLVLRSSRGIGHHLKIDNGNRWPRLRVSRGEPAIKPTSAGSYSQRDIGDPSGLFSEEQLLVG